MYAFVPCSVDPPPEYELVLLTSDKTHEFFLHHDPAAIRGNFGVFRCEWRWESCAPGSGKIRTKWHVAINA